MNDNDFEHLPQDLQDIARALSTHREVADGHLLERVLARVKASPRPKRGFGGFFRARLAALSMLVLCLGLNVSGALASVFQGLGIGNTSLTNLNLQSLLTSLTTTVSTGTHSQSAADQVYCPEGGKSGSDDNSQSGGSEQNGGGSEQNSQKSATTLTSTNGTNGSQDSEQNGGSESNGGGGGGGQCTPCPTGSGSGSGSEQSGSGGSEQNSAPMVTVTKSSPVYSKGVTTYTQTTTTTTQNGDNGGSEQNGGGGQCNPCPPSGSTGSEQNGGSENVQTKVDTYSNNKMVSTTTTNTTKDGDTSGSETNGGSGCPSPPPEKPGCGNEQNIGISGASGAHGGQPPKLEERGSCPHTPGVDGS